KHVPYLRHLLHKTLLIYFTIRFTMLLRYVLDGIVNPRVVIEGPEIGINESAESRKVVPGYRGVTRRDENSSFSEEIVLGHVESTLQVRIIHFIQFKRFLKKHDLQRAPCPHLL